MAYFYRLIVGLLFCSSAFALVPKVSSISYQIHNKPTTLSSDFAGACTAYKVQFVDPDYLPYGYTPTIVGLTSTSCPIKIIRNSDGVIVNNLAYTIVPIVASSCPVNSTVSGTSCACNSGFVEDATATSCVSVAVSNKAVVDGLNLVGAPLVGSGGGLNTCYAGVPVVATGSATGGSVTNYFGPFKVGTHDCSAAPVATSPVGAAACKTTEYFGQLNGVDTCIPATTTTSSAGSVTATPPGVTASTPSGTASAPVIAGAPSGTVGTSTVTTCVGGNCSTVTSFTGSGGSDLGTKTESVPQKTFCAENPTASVCVSGTFSGSCGAPPACSGDAVMCAVAAATFATNCTLSPSPNSESAAYDAAKLVTGEVVSTLPGSVTTAFGPSSFDQTELLGAAQGLSSFDVQVMGQTMSVDMSVLNVWLVRLGYILQALSFMLAVRIVGRGY